MVRCAGRQDAHGVGVLPGHALCVVVVVARQQGVSHVGVQLPSGNIQRGRQAGKGILDEVILPLEVVGVEVLGIEIRLLQGSLEVGSQGNG